MKEDTQQIKEKFMKLVTRQDVAVQIPAHPTTHSAKN